MQPRHATASLLPHQWTDHKYPYPPQARSRRHKRFIPTMPVISEEDPSIIQVQDGGFLHLRVIDLNRNRYHNYLISAEAFQPQEVQLLMMSEEKPDASTNSLDPIMKERLVSLKQRLCNWNNLQYPRMKASIRDLWESRVTLAYTVWMEEPI